MNLNVFSDAIRTWIPSYLRTYVRGGDAAFLGPFLAAAVQGSQMKIILAMPISVRFLTLTISARGKVLSTIIVFIWHSYTSSKLRVGGSGWQQQICE